MVRVILDDPRTAQPLQRHAITEVGFGNELTMTLALAHGAAMRPDADPRAASWLWHPAHFDSADDFVTLWERAAPYVLPTLRDAYGIEGDQRFSAHAVVHCRCNPIPFVRHPEYHLPASSYWPFVSKHLRRNGGVRRVLVLLNATWEHTPPAQAQACRALADALRRYFEAACAPTWR